MKIYKLILPFLPAVLLLSPALSQSANLALSAVAYQSSTNYISSQAGNFAYDGIITTKWTSQAAPNQWLALDLGQNANITSIVLKFASSCTCDPAIYNLKNYEIQSAGSFSGPWTMKGSFSNPSQAASATHNLSFTTRYIRILVNHAGIDQHVRLPEFEIHGTYALLPGVPSGLQVTAPSCSNPAATFSWLGSGSSWMIDISKTVNGNFDPNNFYNKGVSNLSATTGASGFMSYLINGQVNTTQALVFQPGQWYSWRIFNGSQHYYGPTFQAPVCNTPPPPSGACRNIYGIHFWESGAKNIMNGKSGWTVEIVNTEDGQSGGWGISNAKNLVQQIRSQGTFEPIVRINKNWGKTIPNNPADFSAFANDCKNVVLQLAQAPYSVKWFAIGNEPNLAAENSGNSGNNGKGIPADVYAACFKQCYSMIKAVAPAVKIMVAGPGTFNNQGPLTSASGTGVYYDVYFERVVTQVGSSCDGYAIHAYGLANTSSPDNNLQAAYKNSNAWEFDCFRVYMTILAKYSYAKTKAVHITETNTNSHGSVPSSSYYAQWMQQAYAKINAWNSVTGNQQIQSLCWFIYKDYGGWHDYSMLSQPGKMGQARTDFNSLTSTTNYKPFNCPGQAAPAPVSSFKETEMASCTVSIPSGSIVVNSSATLVAGGELAWVCQGATVYDQGGADTLYLEQNATCYSNGGGAVIYAKTGSTVVLNGGSEHVYYEPGTNLVYSGWAQSLMMCGALTYDYSQAPSPGCMMTGTEVVFHPVSVNVYPNPATDWIDIEIQSSAKDPQLSCELFNAIGAPMLTFVPVQGVNRVDVSRLPEGIYFLSIRNKEQNILRTIKVGRR